MKIEIIGHGPILTAAMETVKFLAEEKVNIDPFAPEPMIIHAHPELALIPSDFKSGQELRRKRRKLNRKKIK